MNIKISQQVKAEEAQIYISFSPTSDSVVMRLEYLCNRCAGHGCNRFQTNNPDCNNGSIKKEIDPTRLGDTFEGKELEQIKKNLANLVKFSNA